jgi:hypothetical protein
MMYRSNRFCHDSVNLYQELNSGNPEPCVLQIIEIGSSDVELSAIQCKYISLYI